MCSLYDFAHAAGVPDVSGIDSDAGSTGVCCFDGAPVVKVNVGDDGNAGLAGNFPKRDGGVFVGTGNPHDVRTGILDLFDLFESFGCVGGLCVCHGLDAYGSIAADGNVADLHGIAFPSLDMTPRTHLHACVEGVGGGGESLGHDVYV